MREETIVGRIPFSRPLLEVSFPIFVAIDVNQETQQCGLSSSTDYHLRACHSVAIHHQGDEVAFSKTRLSKTSIKLIAKTYHWPYLVEQKKNSEIVIRQKINNKMNTA